MARRDPLLGLGLLLLAATIACLLSQQLRISVGVGSALRKRLQLVPSQVAGVVRAVRDDTPEPRELHVHGVVEAAASAAQRAHSLEVAAREPQAREQAQARPAAEPLGATNTAPGALGVVGGQSTALAPGFSCERPRRPYHVVLTAAAGVYQEWQTRIAYYHYKRLKAASPCSDIGGFTRLLNTPNAQPDALMAEIPTVLVSQLRSGSADDGDHGFIVMNRPWGVRQFTRLAHYAAIAEDYIFLVETDHLLLRPLPNTATAERPVGFGFYYMTYKYDPPKLRHVIARWGDPDAVDPVGPSPVIIHKETLRRLVDPWWALCLELKRDRQANAAFGWVLEMWAYALACAKLNIRHSLERQLQAEPGGPGIPDLERYYIYHYTFDLEKFSKRRFMGTYPPQSLPDPGRGAQRSSRTFVRLMNDAMGAINPWAPMRRP